jgi:uncharacterized protein DUF4314
MMFGVPDPTAVARRQREFREGDRVRAVNFVLDEGLRIWPMQDDPEHRWRVVQVSGQRVTGELMIGNNVECQRAYPDAVFGINDNESVPPGTEGTVHNVDAYGSVSVKWDNGRSIKATIDDRIVNISRRV